MPIWFVSSPVNGKNLHLQAPSSRIIILITTTESGGSISYPHEKNIQKLFWIPNKKVEHHNYLHLIEFFLFNPNIDDVWNPCQVWGGVATSPTWKEHSNLPKFIKFNLKWRLTSNRNQKNQGRSAKNEHDFHHEIFWPFQRKNSQSR